MNEFKITVIATQIITLSATSVHAASSHALKLAASKPEDWKVRAATPQTLHAGDWATLFKLHDGIKILDIT